MSGTEFQRAKEDAAAIMREKQRKGGFAIRLLKPLMLTVCPIADERRQAEAAAGKKK